MHDDKIPPRARPTWKKRFWLAAVLGMTVLSSARLIVRAAESPEGWQLRAYAPPLFGFLIVVVLAVFLAVVFLIPSRSRVRHIRDRAPSAPAAYTAGLAEDGNDVLAALGSDFVFPKLSHAIVSFGVTPSALVVYRRFSQQVLSCPLERVESVFLERRTLASGPDREVVTFLINDEAGAFHHLSLTLFSPGKLYILPYSQKYMQLFLSDLQVALVPRDRSI